jgi:CRP-like cAMP-binding protein
MRQNYSLPISCELMYDKKCVKSLTFEMSKALHTYLKSKMEISHAEFLKVLPLLKEKTVSRGSTLLAVGEVCRHAYFVVEGCLRSYVIDEKGKEHIIQFAPENWWISEQISLMYDEPSMYFIDAVEDSALLELNADFFDQLHQLVPQSAAMSSRLQWNSLRSFQKRLVSHLSASGEERYVSFIKTYPQLALRLPQKMIASYLGVTPESLSRIRKELASV